MDDIIKLILMNLKISDIHTSLFIDKYWNTHTSKILNDDKFWKQKFDERYYFLSACFEGMSYKDKYITLRSINNKNEYDISNMLFKRVRTNPYFLESEFSVRNLLSSSEDLTLLATISCKLLWNESYEYFMNSIRYSGDEHCGDCVKVAVTCDLCFTESMVINAIVKYNEWMKFMDIQPHDLVVILIFTGFPHIRASRCFIEENIGDQLTAWVNSSDDEKAKSREIFTDILKEVRTNGVHRR